MPITICYNKIKWKESSSRWTLNSGLGELEVYPRRFSSMTLCLIWCHMFLYHACNIFCSCSTSFMLWCKWRLILVRLNLAPYLDAYIFNICNSRHGIHVGEPMLRAFYMSPIHDMSAWRKICILDSNQMAETKDKISIWKICYSLISCSM